MKEPNWMEYEPTMLLRFVERFEAFNPNQSSAGRHVRILQQWWTRTPHEVGEIISGAWRDVPLELEQ